jgi:hypothetical protein
VGSFNEISENETGNGAVPEVMLAVKSGIIESGAAGTRVMVYISETVLPV